MTTGTKTARDAVGDALDPRLAGLGLLDELAEARKLGVGADARGLDDQTAAADVDGAADDADCRSRRRPVRTRR